MINDSEQPFAQSSKQPDLKTYAARRTMVATMVAHALVFTFTCMIAYSVVPGSSLFSWHPFLMTLAFVLFMTEGILMFSQQSSFIRGDRKLQVRSHWVFQVMMLTCAILGCMAIFTNKNNNNVAHFTTAHGRLGAITVFLSCGQVLAGIGLLYPNLIKNFVSLGQAKIYHATFGLLNYTLVTLDLNFAMRSDWAVANITGVAWYVCVACIDILALVIMTQITTHYLPRMRRQRQ
ncbi:transmembrane reductase CYB561D2-like [Watersipora subatra]|uniref:transmembrane reductase CYB561D2-like n=1 Tax=Watersipora subatra TaxID=2589382 RepID=UPI00355B272E